MRAALLCLVLLMSVPHAARAGEAAAELKAQAAVDVLVATCLKENLHTACIQKAAMTCIQTDIAPIEPVFLAPKAVVHIFEWCANAEQKAWQHRLDADIQSIMDLLPTGPAQREFEEQQRTWENFVAMSFPYNHFDSDSGLVSPATQEMLPLVAIRSVQVESILDWVRECITKELLPDSSVCKYMNAIP
ncbi:MAG: hypothetical protein H7245_08890 [Candidatus Saccharibacteria bacterium]|nr:hypothetical protein [Pseudorhodobacter sp.]